MPEIIISFQDYIKEFLLVFHWSEFLTAYHSFFFNVLLIVLLLFLTFLIFRKFRLLKLKKILSKEFNDCPEPLIILASQKLGTFKKETKEAGGGVILPSTISAGDAIFHLSQIDPTVLNAIDTAHGTQAFESYRSLVKHVEGVANRGSSSWEGMVNQYKGYVGEHFMGGYLQIQGHNVDYPTSPNQEGYDAIVDGEKVQFKSGLSPSAIQEHQERFPEIPVFTVQEHKKTFMGNENINVLPISGEEVQNLTENTLRGIEGQTSHFAEFPTITAVLSGGRNILHLFKGHLDWREALKFTGTDIAGVGVGGMVGGAIGMAIGIFGGPPGMAAGEVVGNFLGAKIGSSIARDLKKRKLQTALQELKDLFSHYPEPYAQALKLKARTLRRKSKVIMKGRKGLWLWPNLPYVIRTEVAKRYKKWAQKCERNQRRVAKRISKVTEPTESSDLGRELFFSEEYEPAFSKTLEPIRIKIRENLQTVFKERQKLGF